MTNNVGFLSLVREEFLARGIPNGDNVSVCKVKKVKTTKKREA